MNNSSYLNFLLAIAIVVLAIKVSFNSSNTIMNDTNYIPKNDSVDVVMNNIMTRTSIRAYTDKPVEDEKIEKVLRAGMSAPTAGNKQPWNFVIVTDKNILRAVPLKLEYAKPVAAAPLAIVVCGDLNKTFDGEGQEYWVQDLSAASQNILLASHSLGLGAVWCGVYPISERVNYIKDLLNLPDNIIPLNIIAIGYPNQNPRPKNKWNNNLIHYNKW